MSRLIESIRFDASGAPLMDYHRERMAKSLKDLWSTNKNPVNFDKILEESSTLNASVPVYKLRIVYDPNSYSFEFLPYTQKKVNSLLLIESDDLEYNYKFEDRSELNQLFQMRQQCDDILISVHGALTDTLYCNTAYLLNNRWYTPDQPLLAGTRRQYLIDTGKVEQAEIYLEDIPDFEMISLFNAMIDLEKIMIPASSVQIP